MAKPKPIVVRVSASSANSPTHVLRDVVYKSIALKEHALRFMHLERKGNTWVLLDALDGEFSMADPTSIRFDRSGKFPVLNVDTERLEVSIFTVIHLPGEQFWHLDQMPDGKWRITLSDDMDFPPHDQLTQIDIRTQQPE